MVNQFFYWFGKIRQPELAKDMRPKAYIQQMGRRVIAADIHIERRPVICLVWRPGLLRIVRIGIPQQIPATASVTVHRVSFAPGWRAANRTSRLHPVFLRRQD